MCAEFISRTVDAQILNELEIASSQFFDSQHVRIYQSCPAITPTGAEDMGFSLKPPGTPYPTFNARLASWDDKQKKIIPIFAKRTWTGPLKKARCLVPIDSFIEPVYLGEHAGQMMQFTSVKKDPMYCAAIFEEGHLNQTGEVYLGFSLILHTPGEFILRIGHHREPLFLDSKSARLWLTSTMTAEDTYQFLLSNQARPQLEARPFRSMAKGWEKRVSQNQIKLQKEKQFMEQFKA